MNYFLLNTGYASKVFNAFECASTQLTCPPNYNVIIRSSFYGVSSTNECLYK